MEKVFKTFYVSQRKRPVVHFDLLKGANFEGFSLHFGLNSLSVRPSRFLELRRVCNSYNRVLLFNFAT